MALALDARKVTDETEKDETVSPVKYEITSYGADMDVEVLVNRLKREDIFVPKFQRDYVWTITEASRFIESLLLGLPVPGIFLARESSSRRLLVIDGQQRLKSLHFFIDGEFNPRPGSRTTRNFILRNVQPEFDGVTYESLSEDLRRDFNSTIIHATIIKQDSPAGDQSSIFHIFERLNTSGRKLSSQQIRVAIYRGELIDLIRGLNDNSSWRSVYGPSRSPVLKDQELILRFLALFFGRVGYKRPMTDFLNRFTFQANTNHQHSPSIQECKEVFENTIARAYLALKSFDKRAFSIEKTLNAAVFDSVMVGIAELLKRGDGCDPEKIRGSYRSLLANNRFQELVSRATADEKNIEERIKLAVATFLQD